LFWIEQALIIDLTDSLLRGNDVQGFNPEMNIFLQPECILLIISTIRIELW